jgi:hypothetical protein
MYRNIVWLTHATFLNHQLIIIHRYETKIANLPIYLPFFIEVLYLILLCNKAKSKILSEISYKLMHKAWGRFRKFLCVVFNFELFFRISFDHDITGNFSGVDFIDNNQSKNQRDLILITMALQLLIFLDENINDNLMTFR